MSEKKEQCQLIYPAKTLQARVPMTGGPSMDDMTADAEAALLEIKDTYETVVRLELQKISDAISRATETPTFAADARDEIFDISHNIKGQAASFDYPLLGSIAQSLCRFISASEPAALKGFDVIGAHAKAMKTVVAHSVRGDGLEKGRKLLTVLNSTVDRALAGE